MRRLGGAAAAGLLTLDELDGLVTSPIELSGTARSQVSSLVNEIAAIAARYPEAARYRPGEIL